MHIVLTVGGKGIRVVMARPRTTGSGKGRNDSAEYNLFVKGEAGIKLTPPSPRKVGALAAQYLQTKVMASSREHDKPCEVSQGQDGTLCIHFVTQAGISVKKRVTFLAAVAAHIRVQKAA